MAFLSIFYRSIPQTMVDWGSPRAVVFAEAIYIYMYLSIDKQVPMRLYLHSESGHDHLH